MSERLTTFGEDLATVAIGAPSLVVVIAGLVAFALHATRFIERRRDRRKGRLNAEAGR